MLLSLLSVVLGRGKQIGHLCLAVSLSCAKVAKTQCLVPLVPSPTHDCTAAQCLLLSEQPSASLALQMEGEITTFHLDGSPGPDKCRS